MTPSTPGSLSAASAAAPLASAGGSRRFGRFVLQDLLGRSSTTMAWQAHDTRARHDVLLMLPRNAPDALAMPRWIEGARRTARLSHPRLVPVCDIGVEDRWPYVACDLAEGVNTLGRHVASLGTPPPMDVARWCSDALEGLAYAHEAGVAHGDLGLHSLAIDGSGRIAVWGFAAAAAETAAPGGATLDPTLLRAQRDEASVDVLHAGLILHNLLAGEPALGEADMHLCVARMDQEMVRLPWTLPHPVPEALRAIVNRATDKHLQRRYLSARGLLRALTGWQQAQADDKGGALALLIDRLVTVGHLPGRPGLAQRVVQLSRMESQRLNELADVVLQDPALAFELLRTINSAQFHSHSDGVITTVRRAMQLVGLNGVRRAASSLRAWPGPLREAGARALEQGMRRACLAGHVAEFLAPAGLDAESALLAAQLQHLGRLLILYHFPDEAAQIAQLMQSTPPATPEEQEVPGLSEDAAAMAVLGVDLGPLSAAVGRHWGLGEALQQMMRPLPVSQSVRAPDDVDGWVRLVASCANETLDISRLSPQKQGRALAAVAARYQKVLETTPESLREVLIRARSRVNEYLAATAA
jgi:HD-like signal output (HDOD) protein